MQSASMEQKLKYWLPLFEAQAQSGLNKQDWCERNGITKSTFYRWQRICQFYLLAKNQDQTVQEEVNPEVTFVELNCSTSDYPTYVRFGSSASDQKTESSITISRNGFKVYLDGDINEIALAKVLRVIAYAY